MKYRERARWGLTADECRYIYSICQMFAVQDKTVQTRILNVLEEVTSKNIHNEHEKALRRKALWSCLSTKAEQWSIATEFYLDQSNVSRMVKEFYKTYKRRYLIK